jgi:hypothetical protein
MAKGKNPKKNDKNIVNKDNNEVDKSKQSDLKSAYM